MTEVQQFLAVDWHRFIVEFFAVLLFTLKFSDIIGALKQRTGFKTKWETEREKEQKAIERHDHDLEEMKETMKKICDKINVLSMMVQDLKSHEDESERYSLKARISSMYRVYHERYVREPLDPVWTLMEKESFSGLIKSYENHGGQNSFVHDICQPESETWLVKEEMK